MEKFNLKHTVLYAKGWYRRSKNIFDDLSKCLEADGYLGTFEGDSPEQIKNRVAYLIVGQFERIPNKGYANSLQSFYEGIKPHNVWKYGYYTKGFKFMRSPEEIDKSPEYDYDEAVVRYCLSHFCGLEKCEWNVIKPDFKNVLKKNEGVKDKKVKEIFGK